MEIEKDLEAFVWRNPQANNCNTYLIRGDKNILIDPGHLHLFDHVRMGLSDQGLTSEQIDLVVITHGHPDHLEAALLFKPPTLTAISLAEMNFFREWTGPLGMASDSDFRADFFLQEGDLKVGNHTFQVFSTPGHSPGSICLYWLEKKALFSGDVVFSQGVGRTDLPGGNGALLKESIRRLAALDIEMLLSGHGEVIKGKKAVQDNFKMIEDYWFNYI
jgi:hydroxyacylglutathione hydrolase